MYLNQKNLDLGESSESDINKELLKSWKLLISMSRDKEEFSEAIGEILALISNCHSYNCLSIAKKLIIFLSDKSDLVRTFAVKGLNIAMRKATQLLSKEEDPKKVKELVEEVKTILNNLKKQNIVSPANLSQIMILDNLREFVINENFDWKITEEKKCPLTNFQTKDTPNNKLETYKQILQFSSGAKDINSSISTISGMMNFLNSDNKEIRDFAAKEICKMFKVAAKYLIKETNPKKIIAYAELLLNLANKVQMMNKSGKINLPIDSLNDLNEAISMIREKVKSLYTSDSFRSNKDNPFKDKVQNLFNNMLNLTEGKSDEFVSS